MLSYDCRFRVGFGVNGLNGVGFGVNFLHSGFDDVIVGVPEDDNNGPVSGAARVFSGVDGSILYTFEGDSAGDDFGFFVDDAGDVNADGFADVIVGAPSENDTDTGFVRVFSGVDGSVLYNFDGDSAGDRFGVEVSGAGDVNGDGVDDFIAAVNGYVRVFVSQIMEPVMLGDIDQDGDVTFADVPPFIDILKDERFVEEADCNLDDEISFADIPPFIGFLFAQ